MPTVLNPGPVYCLFTTAGPDASRAACNEYSGKLNSWIIVQSALYAYTFASYFFHQLYPREKLLSHCKEPGGLICSFQYGLPQFNISRLCFLGLNNWLFSRRTHRGKPTIWKYDTIQVSRRIKFRGIYDPRRVSGSLSLRKIPQNAISCSGTKYSKNSWSKNWGMLRYFQSWG